MPSILKRQFAPISDEAWSEIDEEAARVARANLAARKVVDFSGPHGWEVGAVNLGRLNLNAKKSGAVGWGLREVQPLIETRTPFTLDQMELDDAARGCQDVDLDPLVEAVTQAARFEDQAVFTGFAGGNIDGMAKSSDHKPVALPKNAGDYPKAVAQALRAIQTHGIVGPYAVVLGPDAFYALQQAGQGGFPPFRIVEQMLQGGSIELSPVLKGGFVLSTRGGDFELTVGKDLSVGYAHHDAQTVELYVAESFTFRVYEPRAVVELRAGTSK